jgi:LPS-assembly lipoprotein
MWLFNRRALFALPFALAACGFTPAFGPNGAANVLRGAIELQAPTNRNGFDFVRQFEERLGRAQVARFDLTYTLATESVQLGVTPQGAITRYNLLGSVDWQLTDRTSKTVVARGREQNFTAWSATGVTIAAVNAETDASSRLMRILADQVVARLIASASALQSPPE